MTLNNTLYVTPKWGCGPLSYASNMFLEETCDSEIGKEES